MLWTIEGAEKQTGRERVLSVETDHPVHSQEIKLRETELRRALGARLGDAPVRLAVVSRPSVGPPPAATARTAVRPAPVVAPADPALDRIADPELRAALASLRSHLGREDR